MESTGFLRNLSFQFMVLRQNLKLSQACPEALYTVFSHGKVRPQFGRGADYAAPRALPCSTSELSQRCFPLPDKLQLMWNRPIKSQQKRDGHLRVPRHLFF